MNTTSSIPNSAALRGQFLRSGSLGDQAEHRAIEQEDSVAIGQELKANFNKVIELDNSPQDRNPAKGSLDLSPEGSDITVKIQYQGTPGDGSVEIEQSNQDFETFTQVRYSNVAIDQVMTTEPHDKVKYDPDLAAAAMHVDLQDPGQSYAEYNVFFQ